MKSKNPVNIILLAISFVIFGSLGIIFITQMELLPGYNWDDMQNVYPTELSLQLTGDLNGDGVEEKILYTKVQDEYNEYYLSINGKKVEVPGGDGFETFAIVDLNKADKFKEALCRSAWIQKK